MKAKTTLTVLAFHVVGVMTATPSGIYLHGFESMFEEKGMQDPVKIQAVHKMKATVEPVMEDLVQEPIVQDKVNALVNQLNRLMKHVPDVMTFKKELSRHKQHSESVVKKQFHNEGCPEMKIADHEKHIGMQKHHQHNERHQEHLELGMRKKFHHNEHPEVQILTHHKQHRGTKKRSHKKRHHQNLHDSRMKKNHLHKKERPEKKKVTHQKQRTGMKKQNHHKRHPETQKLTHHNQHDTRVKNLHHKERPKKKKLTHHKHSGSEKKKNHPKFRREMQKHGPASIWTSFNVFWPIESSLEAAPT